MRRMRNSEVTHRHKEIASKKKNPRRQQALMSRQLLRYFHFQQGQIKKPSRNHHLTKIQ